jgi:WD40 repeat protein
VLEGHEDLVWGGSFSPDGLRIATAGADQTTRIWDVMSGKQLTALEGHADGVTAAAFSPDNGWLVTGSKDATALLWDVRLETRTPAEFKAAYRAVK